MFSAHISPDFQLFPTDWSVLVPEGSMARFLSDIIDGLNLKALLDTYSAEGHPGYNPVMMLKTVIFGYLHNIFSTRELEEAIRRDIQLLWLTGLQFPDHTTISRFKSRCSPIIKDIFSQLTMELARRGEIDLQGDLYIDGTTVRSASCRYRIVWRRNSERLGALADEAIQEGMRSLLDQIDNGINQDIGPARKEKYTPEEARSIAKAIGDSADRRGVKGLRGKLRKVTEACDRKERHDRDLKACGERAGMSPTDPECGIMKAKEDGYKADATPNYNVQAATQNQYVTNYGAYDTSSDKAVSLGFTDQCIQENGVKPSSVVEDAGYGGEEQYVTLEGKGIEAVVKYRDFDRQLSMHNRGESITDREGFRLTEDGEGIYCPAMKRLRIVGTENRANKSGFGTVVTFFTCEQCGECPLAASCKLQKNKSHVIERTLEALRQERKAFERLTKPENLEKLRRRSLEPEPVFGNLKHNKGYKRVRHYGKAKVEMDLGLVFMSMNIAKLYRKLNKTA